MTRSTTLLFSVFVGCCFAQTAALKELRSHEYPAAAPLIADHPVYVAGVVNSGTQAAPVCYSCCFENTSALPDKKLIPYFQSVSTSKDPLISGDARFHSGLYPYAQGLFRHLSSQVTFDDLHPRLE
jgi:hypothetical protein